MPTPANAMTEDLSPSDMLEVTAWETRAVSAESLLTSSPVFVLSKNPVSWCIMEENTATLRDLVMRCPVVVRERQRRLMYERMQGVVNEKERGVGEGERSGE